MPTTPPLPAADTLPDADLEDAITTLAANIAAATCHWLTLIAEFDRREVWGGWGVRSCAHWLNWKCGIALGAAREKVRVARALDRLPQIRAAFARGELSYSKVRAMTRVATPANEDALLMIARHGTAAHVEQAVRAYRHVDRLEAAAVANVVHAARACQWHYDEDGALVIRARLPAEAGAVVVEALAAAAQDLAADRQPGADTRCGSAENVPAGTLSAGERDQSDEQTDTPADDPAAARRADALHHLAEQFLARGPVPAGSAERHQIVVHVDSAALQDADGPARCELAQGPALAPVTARRLACDATRVLQHDDETGTPVDTGRRTRTVPPVLRRLLQNRDGGCRFPGCTAHRYVDAHHIRHWADGGETTARNLVLLCRHHHRLVHDGGFTLECRDDASLRFLRPDGTRVPDVPVPAGADAPLAELVAASGVDVSAGTCVPRWCGERLDVGMVVEGLLVAGWQTVSGSASRRTSPRSPA